MHRVWKCRTHYAVLWSTISQCQTNIDTRQLQSINAPNIKLLYTLRVCQGWVQGSPVGGGHASGTRPRTSETGAGHAPSRPLRSCQYNARVANSLSSNISLSRIKEFKHLHFQHEPDSNGFAVEIPKLRYTHHWWYWYWSWYWYRTGSGVHLSGRKSLLLKNLA